ncbi:hypothetical protein J1G42_05735 [Cellulomonas sp. zg-ZUI222]|uniref:hypothetical protein n=1 Tax=Cellulomonas TaxID=1707 RepID=UPI001A9419B8|nr:MULTISPECIES: hypothetical protein [Cellulomonas]MBO0899473.1 hypothetical protein [Cellulomonas sp. zg-ZUI22]MBO0920324.1 hypothetical protein [Cellulomonas wangleii]
MSTTDPERPGDRPTTGGTPGATPADASETDTGRHAVQRPAPTPPDADAPDPVRAPTPTAGRPAPAASPAGEAPEARTAPDPDGTDHAERGARTRTDRSTADDELFPDPNAPRTPRTGTHVLGVLVGLLLAPAALGLLLLGQSRILRVQADGWDASLELLGIVLVSAGAVLLAALLLLGLWTAAVPVTAGLVLGVVGGVQLYAPGIARSTTLEVVGSDAWHLTASQVTVAGTSGTSIAAGVLLLTGGVTVALARRHGVRLGAFRERNRAA